MGPLLTKLLNSFHDIKNKAAYMEELRELQRKVDTEVAITYCWEDLDLEHGFHEVPYLPENDRVRFTISENARVEVLRRLSELNRQRYEEEVVAGLHGKSATKIKSTHKPKSKASTVQHLIQTSLFDSPVSSPEPSTLISKTGNSWGSNASDQILAWLEAHKGWFNKSVILNGCGADSEAWTDAIDELLKDDYIETHGEGDNVGFRAKS